MGLELKKNYSFRILDFDDINYDIFKFFFEIRLKPNKLIKYKNFNYLFTEIDFNELN